MPSNPLARLSWKPPKVSEVVDRRVVLNPRQARELLTAVTYVGQQRRGPYARGQRLMAFYAWMYFAALRRAARTATCPRPDGVALLWKSPVPRSTGGGPILTQPMMSADSSTGPLTRPAACPSRPSWSPSSARTSTPSASPRRQDLQQRPRPPHRLNRYQRRLGRGPDPGPNSTASQVLPSRVYAKSPRQRRGYRQHAH